MHLQPLFSFLLHVDGMQGQKWCGGLGSVQKRMKVWLNGMNRWEYVPIDTQDYYRDDEHIRKGSGKPTTTFCVSFKTDFLLMWCNGFFYFCFWVYFLLQCLFVVCYRKE